MDPRHRDGLLAGGALAVLVAAGTATAGWGPLVRPAAIAVGVVGAVVVELLFLRYPDRLLSAWERRGVPVASAVVAVSLGLAAGATAPWLLGAVCWGLATYLALLGWVLAGVTSSPL